MNYLSSMRPFRNVDDTLGVIYTHGFAGLLGGLLTGVFADPHASALRRHHHRRWCRARKLRRCSSGRSFAGAWVIVWSALVTFILLKVVGLFIPLRMSTENMEIGDIAEHGHEVYPSDIPSLGVFQEASRSGDRLMQQASTHAPEHGRHDGARSLA